MEAAKFLYTGCSKILHMSQQLSRGGVALAAFAGAITMHEVKSQQPISFEEGIAVD